MKRVVCSVAGLFILIASVCVAISLEQIKLQLVSIIAHAIVKKKVVKVYLGDKGFLAKTKNVNGVVFVKQCKDADLIIVSKPDSLRGLCRDKPIFVTNYRGYRSSNLPVGALFWQKGRPVLIFRKRNLERLHVSLPKNLKDYVVD